MNGLKLIAVVISVCLAIHLAQQTKGLNRPADKPGSTPASQTGQDADQPVQMLEGAPYHGMAIQVNSGEYLHWFKKLVDDIADLGADTVLISTAGYQENSNSAAIFIDQRKTLSAGQWDDLLQHARKRGLRVVLMPIVLLDKPRTSTEWRGVIQPPRWDEWWGSYNEYIMHYAKIASRNGVDIFIIGSELISTENQPDMWDQLIAKIRQVYHGKISYSSNWDHYEKVPLWGKMDLVCMTTYHKLSDSENPPQDELNQAWKPIKKDILAWQRKIGKPILFTEVGWPSQDGCSIEPWNYYRKDEATKTGIEEQARCYKSFIAAWDGEIKKSDQVIGVLWWEWIWYDDNPKDKTQEYVKAECLKGYTPKGKPAEKVLRDWFSKVQVARKTAAPKPVAAGATSQPAAAMP